MKQYITSFVRFLNRLRGYFPRKLPVGVTAFEEWTDYLIANYTLPTDNRTSIQFVLANCILSLGETANRKNFWQVVNDRYFINVLNSAANKQVASYVFEDIKEKQKKARQANTEATVTQSQVASGEHQGTA